MVGAILTQNTSWSGVEKAIINLKRERLLSPEAIINADRERLALQLKPSGYFNIKAKRLRNYCNWYLDEGGLEALSTLATDDLRHRVLSVNGVGPETADDILLYAFERPVFVIDAYTRRIFSRLGQIKGDEGYEVLRRWFESHLGQNRSEESRVALFNNLHALIVMLAKDFCRKKSFCTGCPLSNKCPGTD
ncbi:MAG: endonuclease [Gammaproteobacteria bacterium]|nr:endonuclease [Gammaproteobacteria bacterium]